MPWIQVLGAFCLMFSSWGVVVSFGTFESYYLAGGITDEASTSNIAWIGSLQAFLLMFGAALTGTLYDAGYFRQMMWVGSVLMVFGIMMTSLATKYYQFILAQAVCTGIGFGLVALGALATPGTWFVKHRGLAVGLGSTGASVGGIVLPIVLRNLIPVVGFPWAVRIVGFIVLFSLILPCTLAKNRLAPHKRRTLLDVKALFQQLELGLYWLSMFFSFLGFFTFYTFVDLWATTTKLDTKGLPIYYILPIVNAASIFGRIIPNFLADFVGPLNIQVPATALAGILVLVWIPTHSIGPTMVIAILYGFFSGSLVSVPPSALASMTKNLNELGGRIGITFLAMAFGSLIGSPVAGAIVQASGGNYDNARTFSGIVMLVGSAVMFAARMVKARGEWLVKA
ncbi:MFS general substrate transporter [Thozetella sp. PMI_491]|nr:MFS general substrate transporter [Thozetella sp. PMI_491]